MQVNMFHDVYKSGDEMCNIHKSVRHFVWVRKIIKSDQIWVFVFKYDMLDGLARPKLLKFNSLTVK